MSDNLTQPDSKSNRPRLDSQHRFKFACSPGVTCFTECCKDVTIVLTPYDVLRLKNGLKISSGEFLDTYTIIIPKKDKLIPLVVLKMDQTTKKCPLVSTDGCTVYQDRPWPCRMFPLDLNDDGSFSLITDNERCKGLNENVNLKISDWLVSQGTTIYDEMNALLSQVTIPLKAETPDIDNPKIFQMVFMSLYNLDKFKEFVFKSSFLDKFVVDEKRLEAIKSDDLELLKFSFDWIKFGILGQKTLTVKSNG